MGRFNQKSVVHSIFVLLIVLTGWQYPAFASDDKSLIGLQGMGIAVELNPGDGGLSRDQIMKDVNLQLQKAGINVLEDEGQDETKGMPFLLVKVRVLDSHDINVDVQLYQQVTLVRSPGVTILCATWEDSEKGKADGLNFKQFSQGKISDSVDKFINSYLRANPKK